MFIVPCDRYIKLWQDMGHTTFGYRPSTPSILLPPVGSSKAADFIKDLQSAQSMNRDQPVIYHIFRYLQKLLFGKSGL